MNIISAIRKNGAVLIGTLGGCILIFILSQGIYGIVPLLARKSSNNSIGTIAGTKIKLQEYDKQYQAFKSEFTRREKRSPNDEEIDLIHKIVWKNFVDHYIQKEILDKEYKNIGISVTKDELIDMVQGEHINEHIKKVFANPYTKKFDKDRLKNFLKTLPSQSLRQKQEWNMLEKNLKENRLKEKYQNLFVKSTYITDIQKQFETKYNNTKYHVNALFIPYSSIKNEKIDVNDQMIKNYLDSHKDEYTQEESKDILYINLKINPSKEDSKYFETEIEDLAQKFKISSNPYNFAKLNSDNINTITKELSYKELKNFDQKIRNWKKGYVFLNRQDEKITIIYRINKIYRKKGILRYELIKIEKNLIPSENTKDHVLSLLNSKMSKVKNIDDFKNLQDPTIQVIEKKNVYKKDFSINNINGSSQLIKWLYKKNNKSKVSPLFNLDDSFMVGFIVKNNPKGLKNFDEIKPEIKEILLNNRKGDIIIQNLDTNLGNLNEIYRKNKTYQYIKRVPLTYETKYLQNIGEISKSTSYIYSLKNIGDMTTPIKEKTGVVIFELTKIDAKNSNDTNPTQNISEYYNFYEALKDLANVKENIKDFY